MSVQLQPNDGNFGHDDDDTLLGSAEQPLSPQILGSMKKDACGAKMARTMMIVVAVVGMIGSWIASGELVQGLTTEFNHPFFICYITRIGWSVCLLGWVIWRYFYLWRTPREMSFKPEGAFTWKYYVPLALALSTMSFGSGWSWYISLEHTTVAANTALYQTAPVFVFIFSVFMIKEKVTPFKVAATVLCVAGSVTVSMAKRKTGGGGGGNGSSHHHSNQSGTGMTFWGDDGSLLWGAHQPSMLEAAARGNCNTTGLSSVPMSGVSAETGAPSKEGYGYAMCMFSTIMYALFEVLYKKYACSKTDDFQLANSQRFLGLIGVSTLALTWLFPVLDATNVENFAWPNDEQSDKIILNVVLDTVFNVSFLVCILLTSPLFCSLATIMTIPVSIVWDHLKPCPAAELPAVAYVGIAVIACGFICLSLDGRVGKAKRSVYE